MKRITLIAMVLATLFTISARRVAAFCGFYVSKADTKLFNKASKVVLVRHDDKTVLTMANDFRGDLKEFAVVIPVPTFIERDQIHVSNQALLDHLDAYSAPRLVEYFDENPCMPRPLMSPRAASGSMDEVRRSGGDSFGVTVEARYTVGEYDIVILSAKESTGLETWLRENGYRIPAGASTVLGTYLKQGMRFFVARVNLKEQTKLGFQFLRPLQVAYESPKFMLPIRLGMVNADGPQELFVFALTRTGRVETTNYRTVKLPTGMELPLFVKNEFGDFYKAMFSEQVKKENMSTVFLEYAWNMGWCDPCAADPLSNDELSELGVFWLDTAARGRGPAQEVFISRLHLRDDNAHFPEDLVFQETADQQSFQGRYVLRHAWNGPDQCTQATAYRREVRGRLQQEAVTLVSLTGWSIDDVRKKMSLPAPGAEPADAHDSKWWQRIWKKGGIF